MAEKSSPIKQCSPILWEGRGVPRLHRAPSRLQRSLPLDWTHVRNLYHHHVNQPKPHNATRSSKHSAEKNCHKLVYHPCAMVGRGKQTTNSSERIWGKIRKGPREVRAFSCYYSSSYYTTTARITSFRISLKCYFTTKYSALYNTSLLLTMLYK